MVNAETAATTMIAAKHMTCPFMLAVIAVERAMGTVSSLRFVVMLAAQFPTEINIVCLQNVAAAGFHKEETRRHALSFTKVTHTC